MNRKANDLLLLLLCTTAFSCDIKREQSTDQSVVRAQRGNLNGTGSLVVGDLDKFGTVPGDKVVKIVGPENSRKVNACRQLDGTWKFTFKDCK